MPRRRTWGAKALRSTYLVSGLIALQMCRASGAHVSANRPVTLFGNAVRLTEESQGTGAVTNGDVPQQASCGALTMQNARAIETLPLSSGGTSSAALAKMAW